MNVFIIGIVSSILAIVAFVCNAKARGEEIDTVTMLKMGGLGFALGITNILILQQIVGDNLSSIKTPEFMTGNPDF